MTRTVLENNDRKPYDSILSPTDHNPFRKEKRVQAFTVNRNRSRSSWCAGKKVISLTGIKNYRFSSCMDEHFKTHPIGCFALFTIQKKIFRLNKTG